MFKRPNSYPWFRGYAKRSLEVQIKGFALKPWASKHERIQEDVMITSCFAGWLCIQFRWFLVN